MATAQMCSGLELDCLVAATAPTDGPRERVLLIDDSLDAMLLVRYSLEEYGEGRYHLEWVETLREGLELLEKSRTVDIILLDLGLPDSSGLSSIFPVRDLAPEVPVLVLTGDTCEETEAAAACCGVDDYLVKDYVSGALLVQALHSARHVRKHKRLPPITAYELIQRFRWRFEL